MWHGGLKGKINCVQGTEAGELIHYKMIWYLMFSLCIFIFLVLWKTPRCPLLKRSQPLHKRMPLKKQNRLRDELELNDYLTVILARVGMLEYKVWHERPGASSLTQHTSKSRQANDTKLSSDPQGVKNGSEWLTVSLKSLRLPTRAILPPPSLCLILSFCDFYHSFDWLQISFFLPTRHSWLRS